MELVVDDLTEFSYMTALAGIEYGIKGTDYGIEVCEFYLTFELSN